MKLDNRERNLLMDALNALLDSPEETQDRTEEIDALYERLREPEEEAT